jgi:predicted amidohydrolase
MSTVQVGLVQMTCTASKEENLRKAIEKTREAAAKGAQIVCLQELFTSLYFCDEENYDNFSLAETIFNNAEASFSLSRLMAMSQSVFVTYNCASMHNLYTPWISPFGKMSGKRVIQVNLA